MESGAEFDPWAIRLNPDSNVAGMAESLGCRGTNDTESIECLRTLEWENIRDNGSCSVSETCILLYRSREGIGFSDTKNLHVCHSCML